MALRLRPSRGVLLFLAAAAALFFLFREPLLRKVGWLLVDEQPLEKADAIYVAGGDFLGHRILKGCELAKAGWAPIVYMSGAGWAYEQNEADLAIAFARRHGCETVRFQGLPSKALSTHEEAKDFVPVFRAAGIKKILMVTSNYHTARSKRIYQSVGPDLVYLSVPTPSPDYDPDHWWQTRRSLRTAYTEWSKSLAFALGY